MTTLAESEKTVCPTRPSLRQIKAITEYMKNHPGLAHQKFRQGISKEELKSLWKELSDIANSIPGSIKSTRGWIKFWTDMKRKIDFKLNQKKRGKNSYKLSAMEQKINDICSNGKTNKLKAVKDEPCIEDNESSNSTFSGHNNDEGLSFENNAADLRHLNVMEKMVAAMKHQSDALAQVAQASLSNSKSMESIAEASHKQALAVDRSTSTFESIGGALIDVKNAVLSIDYTMKRYYTASTHRENTNLFS